MSRAENVGRAKQLISDGPDKGEHDFQVVFVWVVKVCYFLLSRYIDKE